MKKSFDKTYERLNRIPMDSPRLLSGEYWGELRVFLAVAKWKSFNGAAEYLMTTQPTVTAKVDRLQDVLGYPLVLRSKSGIELTEKGKVLAEFLISVDELIYAKADELKANNREAAGTVRVTSTEGLCGVFIIGGLSDFEARYPNVRLHLKNPVNILGFRENQSDIVLNYGMTQHEGVISRPAGTLHLIPMASRAYFQKYGKPTLANISAHRFVDAGYYFSENDTWRGWRETAARGFMTHVCDNTINHARMIKAGFGIGLTGSHLLADPDLIPIDLDVHVKLPLFLHASSDRLRSSAVRATFDWMAEIFNSKHPWFGPELNLNLPKDKFNSVYHQYFADMDDPPVIAPQ